MNPREFAGGLVHETRQIGWFELNPAFNVLNGDNWCGEDAAGFVEKERLWSGNTVATNDLQEVEFISRDVRIGGQICPAMTAHHYRLRRAIWLAVRNCGHFRRYAPFERPGGS